jgi:hypothetical protein
MKKIMTKHELILKALQAQKTAFDFDESASECKSDYMRTEYGTRAHFYAKEAANYYRMAREMK